MKLIATMLLLLLAAAPTSADEPLAFVADWTSFVLMGDSTMSRVEFYLGVNRLQLVSRSETVTLEDGRSFEGHFISLHYKLSVQDSNNVEIASTQWDTKNFVEDSAAAASEDYLIVDGQQLVMDPGEYSFVVNVTDRNSRRTGREVYHVGVPAFPREGLVMSQLEFAMSIAPTTGAGETFVRGNLRVLPNPYAAYARDLDTVVTASGETVHRPRTPLSLPYYVEVYGLSVDTTGSSIIEVSWKITDATGAEVRSGEPVSRPVDSGTALLADQINITTLRAGRYRLAVSVTDASGHSATSSREFYVVGGPLAPLSPYAGVWDEDASARARDEILYIATNEELRRYDNLQLSARAAFLVAFWEKRDPTPGTAKNEAREEHYRRIAHAVATYSSQLLEEGSGWRTDMGRVYVKYGPPTEIERHAMEFTSLAYEIWTYSNVLGGVEFVFADERGTGRYDIVHSTAPGERYNPNWSRDISPSAVPYMPGGN
jgi:GWxTD domain-containing protein